MHILKYTVNYGNFDRLKVSNDVLVISKPDGDRRGSRFYKINSHLLPPHDISIYFDANVRFHEWPSIDNMERDWLAQNHICRDCLFQEAQAVLSGLADPKEVGEQIQRYRDEGMPENFGLYGNCVLIRKNTKKVKELNEMWWEEYKNGCERDQISLPYVFWKNNYKPQVVPPFNIQRVAHGT